VIPFDAVDLFAGPGGWSEGMKQLGMRDLGLELDDAACRTRYAAGHATWQVDVTTVDPCMFRGVPGLIASPPCQDFSTAGGMAGRGGAKGRLVDVVPEWVAKMEPRWVACEQVVGVLPIWQEHAHLYRELGYSVWTGILDAADFGVPQNRLRAILVASIDGVALPPEPTHGGTSLFGELKDRVALADVLGVKPGWVYDSGQNSTTKDGPVRYVRSCDRPAFVGRHLLLVALRELSVGWAPAVPSNVSASLPPSVSAGPVGSRTPKARSGVREAGSAPTRRGASNA
jgi:DNA (cytosine-5)-methyltransferase 1